MGCTSSKDPVIAGKSGRAVSNDLKKAKALHLHLHHQVAPAVDEKGHLMPEEVQKRIVGCSEVQTAIIGHGQPREIQYAYVTQRGYYPTSKSKIHFSGNFVVDDDLILS